MDVGQIKQEIKESLKAQSAMLIKNGIVEDQADWFRLINEKLNIGSDTVDDEGFTSLLIGFISGWFLKLGYDPIELDVDTILPVEEVVVEWASELGIDLL